MKYKRKGLAAGIAAIGVSVILVLTQTSAAFASSYLNLGARTCTPDTVITASWTSGSFVVEHRVAGFAGFWYATWNNAPTPVYHSKDWGYHQVLDARVGAIGPIGFVTSGVVTCG